jgi:hypothetical protein
MKNTWQRFQDPAWQQAAKQRPQGSLGSVWHITDTDTKPERQHKLRVKDWLFKNNLTEELLLNHPSPDDVKLLRELRTCHLYDYFTPSDIGVMSALEDIVVIKRRSLKLTHRAKLEQAVIRANRLYQRQIKRQTVYNHGQESYQNYKKQINEIG